ncbi:MAG: sugar phosphate isomerase/epimerase [Clostridiales bacterium]|jgi:AP endonuclease, family 2|nr:sugar phosphate isomerase/epimerase [Clostridiales bacterium]
MKKGISIWAFPNQEPRDCFRMAKRFGYDGIELSFDESGPISPQSAETELMEIRKAAESHGLSLYSLASGLYWSISLTAEDPAERERAEQLVRKQLDAAAALGCDTILILPGMVSGLGAADPVVPYEIVYERAQAALLRLAEYAEKKRVTIGIENVWNKFLLSPMEMRDFIDRIGSQRVAAYFDVGNVVRDGYPEQWIRILGHRIAKVHFKDYKRAIGTISGFVELLAGDVDFAAVMRALREVGYDGWVTAEVFPSNSDFEAFLRKTSEAMDCILQK